MIVGGPIGDTPAPLPLLDRLRAATVDKLLGAPAGERSAAVREAFKTAATQITSTKHAERMIAVEAQTADLDGMLKARLASLEEQITAAKAAHAEALEGMHASAREAHANLDAVLAKAIKAKLYPPIAKWVKNESRADLQTVARVLSELDVAAREQLGETVGDWHLELAIAEAHAENGAARWAARAVVMPGFDTVRPALEKALAALRGGPERSLLAVEPMKQLECRILEQIPTDFDPELLTILQGHTSDTGGKVGQLHARREGAKEAARRASVVPMKRPTLAAPAPEDVEA